MKKVWNMFKVNDKNTRTTSLTFFCCFYCSLWTYFTPFSSVSIVNFYRVNVSWVLFTWVKYVIFILFLVSNISINDTRTEPTSWSSSNSYCFRLPMAKSFELAKLLLGCTSATTYESNSLWLPTGMFVSRWEEIDIY